VTLQYRTTRIHHEFQETRYRITLRETNMETLCRQFHTMLGLECALLDLRTLECAIRIQTHEEGPFLQEALLAAVAGIRLVVGMVAVVHMAALLTGPIPVDLRLAGMAQCAEGLLALWHVEDTGHHQRWLDMAPHHGQWSKRITAIAELPLDNCLLVQ
jgi:hypothetical protein